MQIDVFKQDFGLLTKVGLMHHYYSRSIPNLPILIFRFASFSGATENGHIKQNKNEDAFSLRQTVNEQRKEIENLKTQVQAKDKRIKQLEEQVYILYTIFYNLNVFKSSLNLQLLHTKGIWRLFRKADI